MPKPNHQSCSCCGVEVSLEVSHIRIGDRFFVDIEHAQEYIDTERKLENARDNFSQKKHIEKKWWGSRNPLSNTPFVDEVQAPVEQQIEMEI